MCSVGLSCASQDLDPTAEVSEVSGEREEFVCGDGILNADEECDDGNMDNTDACLTTCTLPSCGDGFVHAGFEECDEGSPDNTGCYHCVRDRLVFVTSEGWSGMMSGFGGAYARCQQAAFSAGHSTPKVFYPWLNDGTFWPSADFIRSQGRYVLSTGQVIALDWNDLTDGELLHPIDRTIDGILLQVPVWTATKVDGTPFTDGHCSGWSSSGTEYARFGFSDLADAGWTDYGFSLPCGAGAHLYCIEAE